MVKKDLNYYQTFITVAPDSTATAGQIPAARGKKPTKAQIEYELLSANPYTYSQSELLFEVHVRHKEISKENLAAEEEVFFAKSQACLRSSTLPKKLGWGIHFNKEGKIALYGIGTPEYKQFSENESGELKVFPAMRSSRKK
ncbi:DUF6157 family protein [Oceanobacillus sp. FSL W8-0428]|uniref:DUF6157 family protein n=1 Tax=Oceanobacillus sp. FSL W8-0428 TaxID=2921715 RepID=UPI0030FCE518